jgi:hypothetical protein
MGICTTNGPQFAELSFSDRCDQIYNNHFYECVHTLMCCYFQNLPNGWKKLAQDVAKCAQHLAKNCNVRLLDV